MGGRGGGGSTQVLYVLVTEYLEGSLLTGGHGARAEAGTVGLVDDDAIGGGSREEGDAVGDDGAGRTGRELDDGKRVAECGEEHSQVSSINRQPHPPTLEIRRREKYPTNQANCNVCARLVRRTLRGCSMGGAAEVGGAI